jgi:hypothetical protein
MRPIGFSTGALAFADFDRALSVLRTRRVPCVELSALRYREAAPLVDALRRLDLRAYNYVSFHAPSSFNAIEEAILAQLFSQGLPEQWKIILHPDTIHDFGIWREFGSRVAIENMDRRKTIGRTADELKVVFDYLPQASFCFDIGHARQCDPSMTEAYRMLVDFGARLCQLHVSEVNTASQHESLSFAAKAAFQQVAALIPDQTPLIVESRVEQDGIEMELQRVLEALPSSSARQIRLRPQWI